MSTRPKFVKNWRSATIAVSLAACFAVFPWSLEGAQSNGPRRGAKAANVKPAPKKNTEPRAYEVAFKAFKLKNGLRVLLAEDPRAPTYSICVTYNVGSRNEKPGRTGFAHLFEHMMFQGSANVGKGEHFQLVERAGGANYNGTTGNDRTNYYQVLPANRLNLGLWLEADRMRSLAVTAENFANQRD